MTRKEKSEMTPQRKKILIAKSAASEWCQCYKCDGIVNETGLKCNKDEHVTCCKWRDGYRTALLALDKC